MRRRLLVPGVVDLVITFAGLAYLILQAGCHGSTTDGRQGGENLASAVVG
jgi:hypothetical protein